MSQLATTAPQGIEINQGTEPSLGLGAMEGLSPTAGQNRSSERRVNILYMIDLLDTSPGGAEHALSRLTRALPTNRFRCSVVTFAVEGYEQVKAMFPCDVRVFPLTSSFDFRALQVAFRLRNLIRREKIDIVHTFFPTADLFGGAVATLSGVPVLVSSRRDMGITRTPKHALAYRALGRMFDQIYAVSERVRNYCILEDGVDPHKVVTVYNGIDFELFASGDPVDAVISSLRSGGASHIVAAVGNIRRVKGFDVLLQAASIVLKEFPRAVFLIIGNTLEQDCLSELNSLAASLGIADSIRFVSGCKTVSSFLKGVDCFCLTSHSEGFSNALIEGMATGLPCVATEVGGNGEAIVDGISGLLVPPGDHAAVAARILELLKNPGYARLLGNAARERVRNNFSTEIMVARIISLYEGLMTRRGR